MLVNLNAVAVNFWEQETRKVLEEFTFIVEGREFPVRRLIMETASPFFKSEIAKSLNNSCTVDHIDPELFHCMVKFIYKSKLPDNLSEIAQELYEAANDCGLQQLKEICAEEMQHFKCSIN